MGSLRLSLVLVFLTLVCHAQVIEFESGGLKYKTLTRGGVTVMFAHLPSHVRGYSIIQVAVSNGSQIPWIIKVNDFQFEPAEGGALQPSKPRDVINELIEKAGRADVIKLVSAYETSLYGMTRMSSTNGYEQRRQAAHTMYNSARIKAAAAASAIAFVDSKLAPGQSTDGAIFYVNPIKHALGKLVVHVAGEVFEFPGEQQLP